MQGNCSDPGAAASLISTAPDLLPPPLPIKAAQCVVVIGDSLMRFLGGTQWLDNVYFRIQRSNVNVLFVALDIASNGIRDDEDQLNEVAQVTLYMTNVTVQGQRRGAAQVLEAQKGSKILAQGVAVDSDMYSCQFSWNVDSPLVSGVPLLLAKVSGHTLQIIQGVDGIVGSLFTGTLVEEAPSRNVARQWLQSLIVLVWPSSCSACACAFLSGGLCPTPPQLRPTDPLWLVNYLHLHLHLL